MTKYSEPALAELVSRLERCELRPHEFHHEQHLAVTAYYVRHLGKEEALARVRAAIQRFAAYHGAGRKYNEAITRFWFDRVLEVMSQCPDVPLADAVNALLEKLGNKNLSERSSAGGC